VTYPWYQGGRASEQWGGVRTLIAPYALLLPAPPTLDVVAEVAEPDLPRIEVQTVEAPSPQRSDSESEPETRIDVTGGLSLHRATN
jgi:hypothetical protein